MEVIALGSSELPALVVGYGVPVTAQNGRVELRQLERHRAWPSYVQIFDHQYAGYSCAQASFAGVILRLAAKGVRATQHLPELIGALVAMGDDVDDEPTVRRFPILARWHKTSGRKSFKDQHGKGAFEREIREWDRFLAKYIRLPNIAWCDEALVVCEACDPLAYVRSWRVGDFVERAGDDAQVVSVPEGPRVATTMVESWKLKYDPEVNATVGDLGQALGVTDPPTIALLWKNSD